MANRCILHQKKLDVFKQWLMLDGWELHPVKDIWEVVRAKKAGRWLIVYRKIDAKEHYSVRDSDAAIIRRFLKDIKNGGKYGNEIS